MHSKYNPKKIEKIVQNHWEENKTFSTKEDKKKEKYYCLPMFPYPSGNLHMGHVRNYTISDVISRYKRMIGKNVLQPIGWDSFGLPAEEAAIKNKTDPFKWTLKNIEVMKKQLKLLGFSYDWDREITTCHPDFYRWEQWFFIKLFKKKLVYKSTREVNWCSYDKTVLANEQVINGLCWRCGSIITLKEVPQWFLKITKYQNELLNDLKYLKKWPKEVVSMQKNWIGKSTGLEIIFNIKNSKKKIKIYTTKPEKIMHVDFLAISKNHTLTLYLSKKNIKIKNFIEKYKKSFNHQKKNDIFGINTGLLAIHPLTYKNIPIWISTYVKKDYALKAIMGVPNYNSIDNNFSKKYNIKSIEKILKKNQDDITNKENKIKNSYNNNYFIKNNKTKIYNQLLNQGIAKKKSFFRLKDWSISRQRYWGTPIPIVTTKKGKIICVSENELPILLPKSTKNYKNKNFLKKNKKWTNILINKIPAKRETDTFDTFIESSWYYARYSNINYKKGILDPKKTKYWLPIDQYVGGIEHAIMHLMYFRFYHKLLRDFGFVESPEPVKKLLCQGMVIIESFYKLDNLKQKIWIPKKKLKILRNNKGEIIEVINNKGEKVEYAGKIKMSKSKNNGINPEEIINKYGSDSLRLFLMFAAPIESSLEWNDNGILGMYRFLKKLWNFVYFFKKKLLKNIDNIYSSSEKLIEIYLNNTIIKVTNNIENRDSYNTAISDIIKFFNFIEKKYKKNIYKTKILKKSLKTIIILLYPFTPHISFILWKEISGTKKNIDTELWPKPKFKTEKITSTNITIQINGKKRYSIEMKKNSSKEEVSIKVKEIDFLKKYFYEKKIQRIIFVPNKIINFVISNI